MPEFDVNLARAAILQTLSRPIVSYTATSTLSSLALVSHEALLPIFRDRQESSDAAQDFLIVMKKVLTASNSDIETFAERSAFQSVENTQNAVAGACLVFAHSLADGAIAEFCMVVADYDKSYWLRFVESQTLTIKQIVNEGPDVLLRYAIRKKIREMSLPKKMKCLLANAGPLANVSYPPFIYDRERLAVSDGIRHKLVHGEGIALKIETKDSQDFLFNVIVYASLVASNLMGLGITYPEFYCEWLNDMVEKIFNQKASS